jgi:hypothetical protein
LGAVATQPAIAIAAAATAAMRSAAAPAPVKSHVFVVIVLIEITFLVAARPGACWSDTAAHGAAPADRSYAHSRRETLRTPMNEGREYRE